jgi:threonine dehydratase
MTPPHAEPDRLALVTSAAVRQAASRLAGVAVRTPLLPCEWARPGRPLWLKPESLQPIGSFKIRGAYNAALGIPPAQRERGLVTHSSGNHAQAVAWVARRLGVPAVIVIPHGAPRVKVEATLALGAEVIRVAAEDREACAAKLVAERGGVLVSPFDHPAVIAGQGTIGLEIADDLSDVDVVLVPVGGGGLVSGIAVALAARCPGAAVIGVEPELAADARAGLRAGHRVALTAEATARTCADALRMPCLGELAWEHVWRHVRDIVTVSEAEIRAAVRILAAGARLVAEPAGAVATAAYLFRSAELPAGRTVAVVSGGCVDPAAYLALLAGGDPEDALAP